MGHILDAQFAFVVHEHELQALFIGARELINSRPVAAFGIHSPGSLHRHLVGENGPGAPCVALAVMLKIEIESTIGLDGPDSAEGIRPSSNQRVVAGLWIRRAGA